MILPLAGTKEEKDVSDYFRIGNNRADLLKLFLNHLERLYSETMSALKSCEVDFTNPPPIAQVVVFAGDVPLGTQGNLLRRVEQKEMPNHLRAYYLTGMSRKKRLQVIVQSMDKFHYQYESIQLVVIDGIADLIRGANDEAESIAVVEELYRLAGIYRTCIITVLHFIPKGLKLRGHLGSELQRSSHPLH